MLTGNRCRRIALIAFIIAGNFAFFLLLTSTRAQTPSTAQLDAIFSKVVTAPNEPGLAVFVRQNGRTLFERAYGMRDLRSNLPIDAHTNFRLASVTKQFTAMAVMLLVHDGKLSYEERLTDVFPEFPEYGRGISIRNLLNHTSGLLDYEDLMQPQTGLPEEKLVQIQDAEVLKLLEQQKSTKFGPGSRWDYSNSGYVVLGMVVAKVSGEPFGEFLHNRIFAPLGMTTTLAYENGKNQVPNRAYGHTRR